MSLSFLLSKAEENTNEDKCLLFSLMVFTHAAWNRGTPTPISLTIYDISPH